MTPSVNNGGGFGVIDATVENTFSAIVKGNSPVVAYRVGIFKNNATSDLVYNSGVIVLDSPFYGTNSAGDSVPFEYSISANSGVTNGYTYGYKYILTLWWEVDSSDYTTGCVESFETVFYARATPTVSIDAISSKTNDAGLPVISTKSHTFSATYTQANNVPVEWYRWSLKRKDTGAVIEQTDLIYSGAKVEFLYEGLNTGITYSIMVEVQNQDGIVIVSDWVDFEVSYQTTHIQSAVEVTPTDDDGIKIDFGGLKYIEGSPSDTNWRFISPCPDDGHYAVELDSGSSITFTGTEHFAVDIPIDGECVVSFYIPEDSEEIFYASGTDDNGADYYVKLSYFGHTPGLEPSDSLAPSNGLVPSDGTVGQFTLDVNGDKYYYTPRGRIPSTWFVACISKNGMTLYESEFFYVRDRSSMTVVEGYTYGN